MSNRRACTRSNASAESGSERRSWRRTSIRSLACPSSRPVSRSTASTEPVLPTRSASMRVTEPPPAPTSRQRQPSPTPIASSCRMLSGSWYSCSSLRRERSRSGESRCERRYSVNPGRFDCPRRRRTSQPTRLGNAVPGHSALALMRRLRKPNSALEAPLKTLASERRRDAVCSVQQATSHRGHLRHQRTTPRRSRRPDRLGGIGCRASHGVCDVHGTRSALERYHGRPQRRSVGARGRSAAACAADDHQDGVSGPMTSTSTVMPNENQVLVLTRQSSARRMKSRVPSAPKNSSDIPSPSAIQPPPRCGSIVSALRSPSLT
jgi:hypothetical protein